MPLMVSVSGIRGVIGESLHPENLVRYTAAYATWCRRKQGPGAVVIGRDGRPSGRMLTDLVKAVLSACGLDTIDLGLSTTPGCAMAVKAKDAVGGIVLTASHNPAPWNALKFLDSDGNFLSPEDGKAVLVLEEEGSFDWMGHEHLGSYERWKAADRHHIDSILALDTVCGEKIAGSGLKAVVDAVNASGSKVMPELLRSLGVEVHPLYCDASGIFPHEPEPTPAHLGDLSEAVISEKADLGIALDPDSDRLVLVDETGKVLSEEYTLALSANYYLSLKPGPVAANLSSSRMIEDVAAKYGQSCQRSPVGEAHVVALMKESGALIGGEGNGGVILPELHAGRDGLLGAALILSAMAQSGKKLSELAAELPAYTMEKRKIVLNKPAVPAQLQEFLQEHLAGELDLRDGVRSDQQEGWLHVRASNTEAILRIIGESSDGIWLASQLDAVEALVRKHLT